MNDPQIREILTAHYKDCQSAIFMPELGLGGVRADMARLDPHIFCGYEIKSAVDSLVRLPRQVEGYGTIFDWCCLVVDDDGKHLDKAVAIIPDWWAIATAYPDGRLVFNRPGAVNEDKPIGGPLWLLWKDELLAALEERGGVKGLSRLDKNGLRHVLSDRMKDHSEVRSLVVSSLLARDEWRLPKS